MYLGWMLPATSSDSFVRSNWFPTNTVLHAGRIFAVAPHMFPYRLTLTGALASRLGRLCSHPYPRGRRALPATILHCICIPWACPDFPLVLANQRLLCADAHYNTLTHIFNCGCMPPV